MSEVNIRPIEEDDYAFVYSTWLRSYRFNSVFTRKLTNKVYYEWHHKAIERIFGRGGFCIIACDTSDKNVVFGYIVGERTSSGDIIHFIYVKKAFRKLGIMAKLLDSVGFKGGLFTHYTEFCDEYLKSHEGIWTYNPYLI